MPNTKNVDMLVAKADALIVDCDGTLIETAPLYTRLGFWVCPVWQRESIDWYNVRAGLYESVLMDAFEALQGVTLNREAAVTQMRKTFL
jgi:hypothetical protein